MNNIIPLSDFDSFMHGALRERIHNEMSKIAENVLDQNTDPTKVRELTVKISIKPTKNRRNATIVSKVTSKLAAYTDMEADAAIGIDENGEMVIVQQVDALQGQIGMYDDEDSAANVVQIAKA